MFLIITCYFVINSLIFLPTYLLNFQRSTFLPLQLFSKPFRLDKFFANFIRRYNFDIFRFAGDFAFLIILTIVFKNNLPLLFSKILISAYIIFAIIHQTYYHIIKYIYNTEPLIINDIILSKLGLTIVLHGYKFRFVLSILGFIICITLIISLCNYFTFLIYNSTSNPFTYTLFLSIVLFCSIYSVRRYTKFKSVYGFLCFILPTIKFFDNVVASIAQRKKLLQLKQLPYKALNEKNTLELHCKKNIYFIVIESYGSLIFDTNKFPSFHAQVQNINQKLGQSNWFSCTAASESPIYGGTSWLSYSTLLKGIHLNNESTYSFLFSDNKHLDYQPFMQRLQNNGYITYWLSSIGGYKKMKIPWEKTLKFLGLNQVIKNDELTYTGKHFGFGPSPPDQYSLYKAHKIIKEKQGNNPFAMFWITLNSHYPWDSPESIVKNWRSLNSKKDKYWIDNELDITTKYEKAITYQIEFLSDFILNEGTKDDIFILVGDHQPFHITELDNANTPIHIIAKDRLFIEAFKDFNFTKGLLLKSGNQVYLKHAGIQSMLIKVLNKIYGNKASTTYYKNGINEFSNKH